MTPALPKSWSGMYCLGPTATPSMMLPAETVETSAMFWTSWILHSGGAVSRSFTQQMTSFFWGLALTSKSCR